LTGTLSDYVEQCLELPPDEQLNLFEELAVMRGTVADSLKLYDLAQQVPGDTDKGRNTRLAASAILRESMADVAKLCESAARVERLAKDKLSVHNLAYVVSQVVRIAYHVFGDTPEKAREFEAKIREQVRVAADDEGTTLTPDQDVGEMDASVPGVPE
jgi:hypothetical protein